MGWRREIEALVGPPSGSPALVIALAAGVASWRVARPGTVLFDAPHRSGDGGDVALRAAADALPLRDASIAWLAVSFLGDASAPRRRGALLGEIARVLAPGATVVAVDHNRPRRRLAALTAVAGPPRPRSWLPAAAWRRLAYPTAREIHAAGFTIEHLRLAAGERVQIVVARRPRAGA
ncbi:MAG: hypothetical protein HY271_13005 [Deltaproteobacteria bacterium]|nr:hypothetical protein [Deltaproteobacteria bacterium]